MDFMALSMLADGHLIYPTFLKPIIFEIGPFALRWYSLAYIGGLLFAWWYIRKGLEGPRQPMSKEHIDDFLTWATVGVILGGRLGYVLFYNPEYYATHLLEAFKLWDGGMSFHGGASGVVLAVIFYSLKHKLNMFSFGDRVAIVSPIGLLLGRLANFINGELWGRETDGWWGMIFPHDQLQLVRHPSQLYEAFLEGFLLFVIMIILSKKTRILDKPGMLAGIFFLGYGAARFVVEYAREPDAHLNLFWNIISMGQILSIPTFIFGGWMVWQAVQKSK